MNNGYTIIEAMVALVVFSVVLLPLTALLVAESKFEKSFEQKQVAMLVAKNELELAKRSYRKLENKEYLLDMAGKKWKVLRTVKDEERALVPVAAVASPDQGEGGPPPVAQQPLEKTALVKELIEVRVTRDNDTTVLADFSVLKETYR